MKVKNRQHPANLGGGWPIVLFAAVLGVVVMVASVTTLAHVNTHKVSNDAASGTIGLARPHPPAR